MPQVHSLQGRAGLALIADEDVGILSYRVRGENARFAFPLGTVGHLARTVRTRVAFPQQCFTGKYVYICV